MGTFGAIQIKGSWGMMTNKAIQELHDSYYSAEARKLVDYMWGIADKSIELKKVYDLIKSCADDSEWLYLKGKPTPPSKEGLGL